MSWDGPRQSLTALGLASRRFYQSPHDPTIGFFWCLVTVHIVLWTLLTAVTQPNVPDDTMELLSAGRQVAWGYDSQPPMGIWMASAVSAFAAPSIWPLYFLAQLCGLVSVWAAWKLARKFLQPWTALCAALVLLGGYSCTIAGTDFDGAHLASAFWSLSIYMFHSALTKERRRYWVATGFCLALGFLSSYGTLLLVVAMFAFTLWDDKARKCWDSSWPFLAALAMIVVMLPHLMWLGNHRFITIQNGLLASESVADHLAEPLSFLGTQLLCLIPIIILLTPLVSWFSLEEPAANGDEPRDFARRYLLWMTCLPPAVVFVLSLMAGPSSVIFARVSNWTYLGVVLLMWSHLSETRLAWRRSLIRTGTAVGLFAASLLALNVMLPQLQREGMSSQFPGSDLAREIAIAWHRAGFSGTAPVVAGAADLVRNAAWYAPENFPLNIAEGFDPTQPSSPYDESIRQTGGVVVWRLAENEQPDGAQLAQRFGQVRMQGPLQLRWHSPSDLPDLRIAMAVIPPAFARHVGTASTVPTTPAAPHQVSLPPNYPAYPRSALATPTSHAPVTGNTPAYSFTSPQAPAAPSQTTVPVRSYEPIGTNLPANYPALRMNQIATGNASPPAATVPASTMTERFTSPANGQYASEFKNSAPTTIPTTRSESFSGFPSGSSIPSGALPMTTERSNPAATHSAEIKHPANSTIPISTVEPGFGAPRTSTIPAGSSQGTKDPFISAPASSFAPEAARSFPASYPSSSIPHASTPSSPSSGGTVPARDPFSSSTSEYQAQ